MIVKYDHSFSKSIDKLKSREIQEHILLFIQNCKTAKNLQEIKHIKKLKGYRVFYRYSFGSYRIGFELTDPNTILLIKVMHRKDIYRYFP